MVYEVAGVRPVTVHRGVAQEVMSGLPPPRGDAVTVYGPPTDAGAWMVISADVGDAWTISSAGALQPRGAVPHTRQASGYGSASSRETRVRRRRHPPCDGGRGHHGFRRRGRRGLPAGIRAGHRHSIGGAGGEARHGAVRGRADLDKSRPSVPRGGRHGVRPRDAGRGADSDREAGGPRCKAHQRRGSGARRGQGHCARAGGGVASGVGGDDARPVCGSWGEAPDLAGRRDAGHGDGADSAHGGDGQDVRAGGGGCGVDRNLSRGGGNGGGSDGWGTAHRRAGTGSIGHRVARARVPRRHRLTLPLALSACRRQRSQMASRLRWCPCLPRRT